MLKRKSIPPLLAIVAWLAIGIFVFAQGRDEPSDKSEKANAKPVANETQSKSEPEAKQSRGTVLVASLTVFVLAVFVGFEIINKVPPTLHTPLMSGSNAISGITVVGAILAAGHKEFGFATILGVVAAALANVNVVGGFLVTHRMLLMFKKR